MNMSSSASQIQHQQQPNAPFSEAKKQASGRCYVNGTCLSDMEFRYALHHPYCRPSPNLLTHCDDCGAKFSITHGIGCKKGGSRHDEIKFELAARVLIPSVVRDEPQIYPGRSTDVEVTERLSTPTEEPGGLKHQTDCILNGRITNLCGTIQHSSETGSSPSFP